MIAERLLHVWPARELAPFTMFEIKGEKSCALFELAEPLPRFAFVAADVDWQALGDHRRRCVVSYGMSPQSPNDRKDPWNHGD